MTAHMWHMVVMGLLVSVVCPALLLALARVAPRLVPAVPAAVALPAFVVLHFLTTVWSERAHHGPSALAAHVVLVVGALLFWAPVMGRRMSDAARTLYLYAALPLLDLSGVWLVAVGDSAGGLSMVVAMMPMGLVAVAVTWQWIHREERRAIAAECSPGGGGHANDPAPRGLQS